MRKILCALSLLVCSLSVSAGDIYVDKNGSVADALKQAREWRRLNSKEVAGGIRIHLADTVYRLQKPLFIRPEDSGTKDSPTIIIGGTLSGGRSVTGWREATAEERQGLSPQIPLWVADAPLDANRIVFTRQLWVNGRKAQLARGPFVRLSDFNKDSKTITLPVSLPTGEGWGGTELFLLQRWAIAILRIKTATTENGQTVLSFHEPESELEFSHPWPQPVINGEKGSSAAFLQNSRLLLDEPGEFWQEYPSGRIFYIPRPEDLALCGESVRCDAVIPHLSTLVEIAGTEDRIVSNIRFENTRFEHAAWLTPSFQGHVTLQGGFPLIDAYKLHEPGLFHKASLENQAWIARPDAAVKARCARNISFERCSFQHLAATALDWEQRVVASTVSGSQFDDIGGTAIMAGPFGEGGFETHIPYHGNLLCDSIEISRCRIYDATNEDWGAVAIGAGYVKNTKIVQNEVSHVNYSGICVGWGWTPLESGMRNNRIEGNVVSDYARQLYDAGGIYTLSYQPGSTICGNRISAPTVAPYATNDRAFAIYFDEATNGFTVENNQMDPESIGWNQPGANMILRNNHQ